MFQNEYRLEIGTIGLFDHGNNIRKLLLQLPLYGHDSNTVITVLHEHLQELTEKGPLPPTLFLQFDNCFKENKNNIVFGYLAWLIAIKAFRSITLSFLIPGHTHTDIDQIHSTWEKWLTVHDCNTPLQLIEQCNAIYVNHKTRPVMRMQSRIIDIKSWLQGQVNDFSHHAKLRAFKFELGVNGKFVECWYKQTHASDNLWHGPNPSNNNEGYRVFHHLPSTEPGILIPSTLDEKVCTSLPKLFTILNATEQQWYTDLIAKKGNIFENTPFIFKINFSRDAILEPDNSASVGTTNPILRVEAPAQALISGGDELQVEKDHEIFFVSEENELCIALVTGKVVNNFARCRLYQLDEENVNDESENLYVLTKKTAKVNVNDIKLSGKLLTQRGYIYKRVWAKFKAWRDSLNSEAQ